jgi:hypothetical protein
MTPSNWTDVPYQGGLVKSLLAEDDLILLLEVLRTLRIPADHELPPSNL